MNVVFLEQLVINFISELFLNWCVTLFSYLNYTPIFEISLSSCIAGLYFRPWFFGVAKIEKMLLRWIVTEFSFKKPKIFHIVPTKVKLDYSQFGLHGVVSWYSDTYVKKYFYLYFLNVWSIFYGYFCHVHYIFLKLDVYTERKKFFIIRTTTR